MAPLRRGACLTFRAMALRRFLSRARWIVLLLPAFALFSSAQVGCNGRTTHADDYAHEDQAQSGGVYGYGYGR